MLKYWLFPLFAFSIFAVCSSLKAQETPNLTVQGLRDLCKGTTSSQLHCLGYISGIGDLMGGLAYSDEAKEFGLCGHASYGAMLQAFMNWAEKHPEKWTENRDIGVVISLKETWPCKSKLK